jgi:hypothetical protein
VDLTQKGCDLPLALAKRAKSIKEELLRLLEDRQIQQKFVTFAPRLIALHPGNAIR